MSPVQKPPSTCPHEPPLEMLKSARSLDLKVWKVLIMDKVIVKIMYHSCKMENITDQEVSLVEGLFQRRKPLPFLGDVYYIQPSKENVVMFMSGMSRRSPPASMH
ncbi:hypothetical protein VNO77_27815 [Canavalia gladiata]|uniref:Uncharacterized protein n=1 Tax=Canavalia gladiata TaxID=3824 RepID=A0AAN9KXZ6_CANGL